MGLFVGYYRVSTLAQGRSGLGLDAQRSAVISYVRGVEGRLVREFEEVESGSKSARTELKAALALCKKTNAVLVIAKLDRLARNVHFISQLMESGVEFIAADMPHANKLTIHIIAAMAEYERDVISQRTKSSLQAAKARGTKLGNPTLSVAAAKGTATGVVRANAFAARIMPTITNFKARGITTYAGIAMALTMTGTKTQTGREWTAAGVRNVILRAATFSTSDSTKSNL